MDVAFLPLKYSINNKYLGYQIDCLLIKLFDLLSKILRGRFVKIFVPLNSQNHEKCTRQSDP